MSDEAFPDAELLFHQAFAAADPAPHLLQLLIENPTQTWSNIATPPTLAAVSMQCQLRQ